VAAGDEASLRRALELEPGRADAAVALARLLLARGDAQEALEVAQNAAGSFQAQALAARIRLQQSGALDLDEAWRAIDAGDRERAVDVLLDAISAAGDSKDDLRQLIVGILDELGVEHPVAREGRRRLAAALY
jgi:putative thioredoxin